MRVLSLFSGVGGFDVGLERAGLAVVGQVEIDEACRRVLAHHWPDVARVSDVRDVGVRLDSGQRPDFFDAAVERAGADVGRVEAAGGIDLICGGFPCQDVSVAGKRAGLDGARSGLWFEYLRIVSELRPAYVLVENVPGLLSSNAGRDFAVILDGLGELGFAVSWAVLDAQHFGVPQRRARVFIVGGPDLGRTEAVLSVSEGCGGHPAARRTQGEDAAAGVGDGVAHALSARPNASHREDSDTYVPDIAYAVAARDGKGVNQREGQTTLVADTLRATNYGNHGDPQAIAVRTAQTGSNGWGVNEDGVAYTLDGAQQAVATAIGLGSDPLYSEGVAQPITGRNGDPGVMQRGATVRRLTPTECLRLMGFEDSWLDIDPPLSDGVKYRQCGNAVVVPVAEWIGRRLMGVEYAMSNEA